MKIKSWYILVIFALVTILHISAISFGWYSGSVIWIDNVQHILSGIAFAMLFLLLYKKPTKKKQTIIYIILFVFVTSIIWELLEFTLLTLAPEYAKQFSLYSPTIVESSEDIISNMIGGVIFAILYLINKK